MKHLVIIPDGVTSKRLSAVEMARRLRDAGYRITLLGPGGDYQQIDGFDYIRVDLKIERPATCLSRVWPGLRMLRSWITTNADRKRRRDAIISAVDTDAYRKLLKDLSPDLLLIDIEAHNHILPAINLTTPLLLFSVLFNLYQSSEAPPLHTDVIPGQGWRGNGLAINWLWLRYRFWKWVHYRKESIRYCGVDHLSLLKHYANSCGVLWQHQLDLYQWLIPFVYKSLPLLVLNLQEMDFPSRPENPIFYVGPMICTDRSQLPFIPEREPIPPALKSLIDSHNKGIRTTPLVYCGFGSFFDVDLRFLQNLIAASNGSDWDVVISLGDRMEPEALGHLPENIHCLKFAPQMELLGVADVAVIHGGLTSVYECIHYGVPMIVYPIAAIDQFGTAARVAKWGLGIIGNRSNNHAETIRSQIESVLSDNTMKERVGQMRKCLYHYRKKNTVADVIGQLIADKQS